MEIKRLKDDPEKLEMFFKSHIPRLLKMDIVYPGSFFFFVLSCVVLLEYARKLFD